MQSPAIVLPGQRPVTSRTTGSALPAPAPQQVDSSSVPFTKAHFDHVAKLIYQRAGIHLHAGKQSMVYNRLVRRLRARAIGSFTEYLSLLDDPRSDEWEQFTNALTTNLTSFFREPHHFPILAEHLKALDASQPISIWCTAASTGEEPYTIAITVLEALGSRASNVRIVASDIDTSVLRTAETGEYTDQGLDSIRPELLKKYFLRGAGARSGMVKVRPEVRQLITFQQVNLLAPTWPRFEPFDVLFCRNVMIYFDKPTQAKIIERFAPLVKPRGLLFTGHSEHIPHGGGLFTLRGKTVYEKAGK